MYHHYAPLARLTRFQMLMLQNERPELHLFPLCRDSSYHSPPPLIFTRVVLQNPNRRFLPTHFGHLIFAFIIILYTSHRHRYNNNA